MTFVYNSLINHDLVNICPEDQEGSEFVMQMI